MALRSSSDLVRREWTAENQTPVLGAPGLHTNTGGAEEEAGFLSELGSLDFTWMARSIQVAERLRFCDEGLHSPLPATEQDILAYIGHLILERFVRESSLHKIS